MKSIRLHAPRTCTALFAAALLIWALADLVTLSAPAPAPAPTPETAKLLLAGGTLAAPFALPVILSYWAEQRK